MTTDLTYVPIAGGGQINLTGQDCTISRVTEVDGNVERNNAVDVQINRALLDEATAASLALADQGDYKKARSNISTTLDRIKKSSSAARNDAKTVAFVSELEATMDGISDERTYNYGGGRSMMTEMCSNVNAQRCTYTKAGRSKMYQNDESLNYQTKTFSKKKKLFGGS